MNATFIVHLCLFLFNFGGSVIQGLTGFGDAVLLQVVWYTATVFSPDIFNNTALGDSPVKAVTLLTYCRILFSMPLLAYMSLKDGIFSWHMTFAMAVPSTITALFGLFIFTGATNDELKMVFGISGLIFAALYLLILVAKYVSKKRKLQQLSSAGGTEGEATAVTIVPETEAVEADGGAEVPPLTPSKLSPSHTRVRVNRNLDENGKIKMSTNIGAAIASAVSGIMGSLTGVGAPAQIIFVLLYDVPQYIIRVHFAMQSIPNGILRFFYACFAGLLTKAMIPLFVTSLLGGYVGLFVGFKLGKVVGPKSYSIFVLLLLLLSSLIMITESVAVLIGFTVMTAVVTAIAAVYEHKETAALAQRQIEMEKEVEAAQQASSVSAPTSNDNEMCGYTRAVDAAAVPSSEKAGIASEEVKRWVAAQEEELDERLSPETRKES